MNQKAITDNFLQEYVESYFGSYFSQTRRLHSDYWYIWCKSGLLDFVCEKLRNKYNITPLDYTADYVNSEMPVGNFGSATIESHKFYDSWNRKEELKKELEEVVSQLRLHRSAFWFLFEKIFYNHPLEVNESWSGNDFETIRHLTSPVKEEFKLQGFTSKEIRKIKSEFSYNLKNKLGRRKLTIAEKQLIDGWCSQLLRKSRPPKDKELIFQIVEQMKHYKHLSGGRDDIRGFASVRQTAAISASEVLRQLPSDSLSDKDYSDAWFRVLVKDLYERFPLLREFIENYQQKLVP